MDQFFILDTRNPSRGQCPSQEAVLDSASGAAVHDLGQTLRKQRPAVPEQCRIFEVQPPAAAAVLKHHDGAQPSLPCNLPSYTEAGPDPIA